MERSDHWLYRAYDAAGDLLYVGITSCGLGRFRAHGKSAAWWPEVESFRIAHLATRELALEAERTAIRTEHPIHNVVHNWGTPAVLQPLAPVPVDGLHDATGRRRFPGDPHIDRWIQRAHPELVDKWTVKTVVSHGSSYTVVFDHPLDATGGFEATGYSDIPPDEVADVALEEHKAQVRYFLQPA